jgi:hypothetical protein
MLQKTMRPVAICDSSVNCKAYLDSMYFKTIGSKIHKYIRMICIGHIGRSQTLDSISSIVKTFEINNSAKSINMRVRIFDCNEQIPQVNLIEFEAKALIKNLLPNVVDTNIETLFLNFISKWQIQYSD